MSNEITKIKQTTFLDTKNGIIVELVGDSNKTMFVSYNTVTEEIVNIDQYEHNGILFVPPKDDLVSNGTILLPTQPELGIVTDDLINEIEDFIYRYLDISEPYRKLASYYVLLTWVYDSFEVLPYLRALGDYGTGKSRFQKVIGSICYKPMFVAGATTPSPIFRIISLYRGTLLLDEADFRRSDTESEIVKILNCGFWKGGHVLRTEGDNKERMPVSYLVYGPKIIATRKRFADLALESRCLTEVMSRNPRSSIPIHLPKEFDSEAVILRNKLLGFRLVNYGSYEVDLGQIIPGIEPRINQIVLPILSMMDDEYAKEEVISFLTDYANNLRDQRSDELPAQILRVMLVMVELGKKLTPKDISERINADRNVAQGEFLVSAPKIGRINKSLFDFPTRRVNGITEILWDHKKAKELCERYGIPNTIQKHDMVDDVVVVEESQKENSI